MESVLSVIEPQHESFTIDKSVGRLSDEIDQFNQDTTNVLLMCAYHSVECCRVIEHHYRANSEWVSITESVRESSWWNCTVAQGIWRRFCVVFLRSVNLTSIWVSGTRRRVRTVFLFYLDHIVAFETENIHFFSQGCLSLGVHQSSVINYDVFVNSDVLFPLFVEM